MYYQAEIENLPVTPDNIGHHVEFRTDDQPAVILGTNGQYIEVMDLATEEVFSVHGSQVRWI